MSSKKADSGALSPLDAAGELYQTGLHLDYEFSQLTFLKNTYPGLLFGSAVSSYSLPPLALRVSKKAVSPYRKNSRRHLPRELSRFLLYRC